MFYFTNVDSRHTVFLFVPPTCIYITTYWSLFSEPCLIISFFCLFLATHIILPRKGGGLKIESSSAQFCCVYLFLFH